MKSLNIQYDVAITLYEYGFVYKEKGDEESAKRIWSEALEIFQSLGSEGFTDKVKRELGVEKEEGDEEDAV